MGLKEYKAKRNFGRTSEPAGRRLPSSRRADLSFVVQKHAASHLHYDFRLEMQGVLKSWAVPKGFPTRRGDRRLAVEVEDHPLEYGGFEGTIPEGNYGAGTVMVWDKGTYQVFCDDPVQGLREGKIHFVLNGKKLVCEWTLVRMRNESGGKPQWLLLKSGEDLPPFTAVAEDRSAVSERTMEQIAGARHRREWQSNRSGRGSLKGVNSRRPPMSLGGVSTKSKERAARTRRLQQAKTSKIPKSSLTRTGSGESGVDLDRLPRAEPEFVEPMKALLVDELPRGSEWLYEIKFDGVRAIAVKHGRHVELISRTGKDLALRYPEVLAGLKEISLNEVVLDGEIVAVDEQGRSAFQLLQSYQTAGIKTPLFYYVFDVLQCDGRDLKGLPLCQRKALAQRLTDESNSTLRFSGSIQADSVRLMKEMRERGLEGLVAKKQGSVYEPGRRSGAWVKFKWTNEQEFVIGGFTQPKGARNHFGALLVGYNENSQLRFAAKVGTGFDEPTLHLLRQKFQKIIQRDCPFVNLPERARGITAGLGMAEMRRCTWLRPELVCQVRFSEWTRDLHLRQPAFLGLREDKEAREVVREKPV